jgi:tetratricopeptide (TPR) repeat protein
MSGQNHKIDHHIKAELDHILHGDDTSNHVMRQVMLAIQAQGISELDAIYRLAKEGKPEKALRRIRKYVEKSMPPEIPNSVHPSLDFTFEDVVYPLLFREEMKGKKFFPAPVPMGVAYYLWGKLLYDMGKKEDAQKKFQKSLEWNPFNGTSYYYLNRYAELTHDDSSWLDNIRKEYHQALYKKNMLEAYAELGRYLIRKGEIAKGCAALRYVMDHCDEKNLPQAVDEEMKKQVTDNPAKELLSFASLCREYGLSDMPDGAVVNAIKEAAQEQLSHDCPEAAAEMIHHLYELTGLAEYDQQAKELLARTKKDKQDKQEDPNHGS